MAPKRESRTAKRSRRAERPEANVDRLAEVRELYERGLCLQAWRRGEVLGPLERWSGADGRILAGRLAWNFGAVRLGNALIELAWRSDPLHAQARYYRSIVVLQRRGPLAAWRFLREPGDLSGADAELRADWLAHHADVLAQLRDFRRAHGYLQRAHALQPDHAWLWVEQASVLEHEDRRDEALAAALRALELRPLYRPAVRRAADLLLQLNREDEALELLRGASRQLESSGVTRQLVGLLMQSERWDEARQAVQRLQEVTPLRRSGFEHYVNGMLSDIAYHTGDLEQAVQRAAAAGDGFFAVLGARLQSPPPDPKRVHLAVRFVRQHFVTCAPATLSALAAYWERPVDHAALAAEICYDGTPDHVERNWAERSGFATTEFRVSWDSARALLGRGVPFTVTTGGATWAHLQAVIGYDDRRGSFTVLEPGSHARCEYLAEEWLSSHRSFGPRGLALVPADRRELLDGLELPDAALYDRRYRLKRALAEHRRDAALAEYRALDELAPGHALAVDARWAIACYDCDYETALQCAAQLLEIYPGEPRLELAKLGLLRSLAKREDLLAFLRQVAGRSGSDPVFQQELADELMCDARCWEEATRRLRRVLSPRRAAANLYASLGELAHRQAQLEDAVELYRFASCLAPTDERFARAVFATARVLGRAEEGLEFLRQRCEQLGAKSGQPAITLHDALAELARSAEAFEVLDAARARRPDDTDLVLLAAERHAAHGRHEQASALLARAEGGARRSEWLAAAVEVARLQGDAERALELALELGALAPLRVESHRPALQALHRSRGAEAVFDYVQAMLARAPDHLGVQALGIDWLRRGHDDAAESALRAVLERHPGFAWAHRELALLCAQQGRVAEAKPQAEEALRLEPKAPTSHAVLGEVLREQGDLEAARAAWREALRLDIDQAPALRALVESCDGLEDRRAALAWIASQLEVQVVFGAGLSAYRDAARACLDGEEVLALLRRELEARPELRIAWAEAIAQLVELGRLEEALELADRAARRFAHDARSWYDLGKIERALQRPDASCTSLERAVELAPGWELAVCDLSDAYLAAGRPAAARALLERAVAGAPRDARFRAFLADLLHDLGDLGAARGEIESALSLQPDYPWAWGRHDQWSRRLGEPAATLAFARRLVESRPRDAQARLALVAVLADANLFEEAIAALDAAEPLAPREVSLHDQRARLLCQLGRFEEAVAACRPAAFRERPPALLRARRAWIESRRGDPAQAIARMREVLEEDHSLAWGWRCLAEWCESAQRDAEAREAVSWLTRLEPQNAAAWEELGDLLERQGERAGARRAFARALEASPGQLGAGLALLDLQLADGDLDGAERVLPIVQRHGGGAWCAVRELRLAGLRGDEPRAEACVRRIVREPCDSDWPLQEMVCLWRESGGRESGGREPGATAFANGRPGEILAEEVAAGRAHAQALFLHASRCGPGEPETWIAALERAVQLEPGWDLAARALGDALQRLGRHGHAADVLEALVARSPDTADNHAFLADLQAVRGDLRGAVITMKCALELRPDLQWGWHALASWLAELGRAGAECGFARQLTRQQPRDPRAWLALIRVCGGADTLAERLDAVRRLIELEPFEAEHHDLHAVLLAEARRYTDARAACAPSVFARPPLALRGRAAWIDWQRGERDPAMQQMEAVLEEDPSFRFGWLQACEWALAREQWQRAERLAVRMTRQFPELAQAHDFLARALLALGRREEAKHAWLQAHRLDRSLSGPSCQAFDLHFEDGELDVAEQVLAGFMAIERSEYTLARAVQIAAARKRRDEALALFAELCALESESEWPLQAAWRALVARRWWRPAAARLDALVAEGKAAGRAVAHWASHVALRARDRAVEARLVALLCSPDLGPRVARAFFSHSPLDARAERIRRALGARLHGHTALWASYGRALLRAGRGADAVRWLADWRVREDLEPWMLHDLVRALRAAGDWSGAAEVGEAALASGQGEHAELFSAWRALDAALAGQAAPAAALLRELWRQPLAADLRLLCQLTAACLAASDASPLEPPRAARPGLRAIRMLRAARSPLRRLAAPRELRLAYLRVAAHAARLDGGLWPRLWCALQPLALGIGPRLRAFSRR